MPTPAATSTPSTSHNPANSRRVPLDKRKRTETSCDKCKSRKQKCRKEPGSEACRYCLQHSIECQTTQPRKKRLYGSVESLGNRLALLESLVKGLLPDADVSNLDELRQLGTSLGIAIPDSPGADAGHDHAATPATEADEPLSLLPDQQGQVQYIGPASSFSFHLKLRALCGQAPFPSFVLFGKNAAHQAGGERDAAHDAAQQPLLTPTAASFFDHTSAGDFRRTPADEAATLAALVAAYFEHINPDFPVLYEHSFREAYEGWLARPGKADLAWQCSFLCVLLLARRVAHVAVPEEQERDWWKRIQALLPVVIFTSSVTAVQAIMLAAIHLHNTNHRDACWNLTGTAIRIAFAIGLHQDKASTSQPPLARELRKRLWWTLYAFEQMQVSSYDRPSAIEHHVSKNSCPNERILGAAAYSPPEYSRWFDRLIVNLSSTCRAPKHIKPHSDESYAGPLSPAAGVLRDLERWKADLPHHLRMEAVDDTVPAFRRPILLLHSLFHYTTIVLCRAALLARATTLCNDDTDSTNPALVGMSNTCTESGRALAHILLKLDAIGRFDAITWWDVWYSLTASSTLVLDLVCQSKMGALDASESRDLLPRLADLIRKHLQNTNVPGTIAKFGSLVPELHAMVEAMIAAQVSPQMSQPEVRSSLSEPEPASQTLPSQAQVAPFAYSHQNTTNGAFVFADTMPSRFYSHTDYAAGAPYSNTRYDRSTQMQFMDFTVNNIQDWHWGDMGNLLGPDGTHPHQVSQAIPQQTMSPGLPPGSAPGPYR
ncbi:uncharacterized protein CC84DRAFT_1168750 [Paraphaeosphaeria sporulosa]|uniref:Zn(2)-C6 fungal-type domain-containing protein n=1 Tax=Paraphaeosphaeria sporulosa TaxID=1460663 RepID=A0A177C238_9PLEO|nr:uncharacterized protein CC84DRAFT_1168750 [Paraphaeosphaeria sporulosa]OAG00700.1 hypothetical protein CC84DRAFT_1168750 [Paraphaeosphaeria sporulosa]